MPAIPLAYLTVSGISALAGFILGDGTKGLSEILKYGILGLLGIWAAKYLEIIK
jgi:hypothetical protein